jgi:glycosyltransferase involved in cell wall biosynthesis
VSACPALAAVPLQQPLLSVVVCTSGRRLAALRRCVASLRAAATADIELIVVDNAARPVVADVLAPDRITDLPVVRVVREPRKGLDNARNRGLAAAHADVIAYIDDDCEVDSAWPQAVLTAFADPDVECVTGRVVAANMELATAQWFEQRYSFDRGHVPQRFHRSDVRPWFPVYPFHLGTGCNMAFRRALLERIGGFDPALDMGTFVGGGGDLDMFARALDAGAVAAYEPSALVRHHHRSCRRTLVGQFIGYGATPSALAMKWLATRRGQRRASVAFLVWYLGDTVRRGLGRGERAPWLPRYLLLAEFIGEMWGPVGYLTGRVRMGLRRP